MKQKPDATPRADRLTIARALREMAGLLDAAGGELSLIHISEPTRPY